MESTLEYLSRMNRSLANDYRTVDGRFSESCSIVAIEVAKRLLAEGKKPAIYWIGRAGRPEDNDRPMLSPKQYFGKILWSCHIFTACENQVWDPMVGKPVSIENYPDLVFEGPHSDIKVKVPYEKMEDFLSIYIKKPLTLKIINCSYI